MTNITQDSFLSRSDHLAWCKKRALEYCDQDQPQQAVTSMLSDLGKWKLPLYERETLSALAMIGLTSTSTSAVRRWVEGFN